LFPFYDLIQSLYLVFHLTLTVLLPIYSSYFSVSP
jgi:hypothetical protein